MSNAGEHPLRFETDQRNGIPVAHIAGDVDLRSAPRLRDQLLNFANQHDGRLIIDLSDVAYMDSSGVGTIVFVKREVERSGGTLVLAGLQPRVRSVFEITHLVQFFTIAENVDEATRS